MNICSCGSAADVNDNRCRRCTALQDLGLGRASTELEIKDAHRLHVKAWHPDRFPGEGRDRLAAQERLKAINAAHQFLTSPAGQKSLQAPSGDPLEAAQQGQPGQPVGIRQAIRELSWWRYALFLTPVLAWGAIELATSNSKLSRRGTVAFVGTAPSAQPYDDGARNAADDASKVATAVAEQRAEQSYKLRQYRIARAEFQTACNAGQMKGCNYLGYLYAEGLGGRRNRHVAFEIYLKACNQRLLTSCASLGSLYQDAGNMEYARTYYRTACSGGLTPACEMLKSTP